MKVGIVEQDFISLLEIFLSHHMLMPFLSSFCIIPLSPWQSWSSCKIHSLAHFAASERIVPLQ